MDNNELCLVDGYPDTHTFHHHNGLYSSQIDYIMHKKDTTIQDYRISISDMDPLNVSDHTLVYAVLNSTYSKMTKDSNKIIKRPNWNKCDKEKFKDSIRHSLTKIDLGTNSVETEITRLTNILHKARSESIPDYRKQVKIKTVGKGIWNKEISEASKASKRAFYGYKQDRQDNFKKEKMKKARKLVRSAQRRAYASKNKEFMEKIMRSSRKDNKLFHQLVRNQRNTKRVNTDIMIFKGSEVQDTESILDGWKIYFENLYQPEPVKCNIQEQNLEKLELVKLQNELIEQMESVGSNQIEPVSKEEIQLAIRKLKSGKSPGADGLSAEHFKNIPEEILDYIVYIINLIFKEKDLPTTVKEGTLTPVLKSGKDKLHPENYRGITETTTLSTLIESIIKDRTEPKLLPSQSKLQRGFTEKYSSLNAAFIVSQAIEHHKELKEVLMLLTLDAQKAFDKLNHELLFNKLYHDGITGDLWLLLRNMYRNVSVKVKWNNHQSDKFIQEQGVRQGAKLSTVLYKRFNNNLLHALERSDLGAKIGNINIVAPTCADDIALLANQEHELQALLNIVNEITTDDIVTINPHKSDLVPLTKLDQHYSVVLGQSIIRQQTDTKHLGIIRNDKNRVNIEDRLNIARRTVYATLGPGLHARRGMSPLVALKIWKTHVLPRCLYGIEILN